MANQLKNNPNIVDTAGTTVIGVAGDPVTVRCFRWVGTSATATHDTCIVKDGNGLVVWSAIATGADYTTESMFPEKGLVIAGGFAVTTLSSGSLYIYFV